MHVWRKDKYSSMLNSAVDVTLTTFMFRTVSCFSIEFLTDVQTLMEVKGNINTARYVCGAFRVKGMARSCIGFFVEALSFIFQDYNISVHSSRFMMQWKRQKGISL